MNGTHNHIIRTIILLFTCVLGTQAVERAHFNNYNTHDGLTANRVLTITLDDKGFLWLGTNFGFDRFDGVYFRHFKREDYPTIENDEINNIHYANGRIWACGFNGLVVEYNPVTDMVTDKMPSDFNETYYKTFSDIYTAIDGCTYGCTTGGLYKLDTTNFTFSLAFPEDSPLREKHVRCMYQDKEGIMWLGSYDRTVACDKNGKIIFEYVGDSHQHGEATSIIENKDGRIAVSMFSNELWLFTKGNPKPEVRYLPFSNVTKHIVDKYGRHWFTTDGLGLWYSDNFEKTDQPNYVNIIPYEANEEAMQKIYDIDEDQDGTIWVATQNSGLWEYRRTEKDNIIFSADEGFPKAVCSCFQEDKEGNIYVGTDGRGIYKVNRNHKYQQMQDKCKNVLAFGDIQNNKIAIATWGNGIQEVDIQSGKSFSVVKPGQHSISNYFNVTTLKNGDILGASAGDGICRFNENGLVEKLAPQDTTLKQNAQMWITKVKEHKDQLWVLSTNTLGYYQNGRFRALLQDASQVKSKAPTRVTDFTVLDNGEVYATTSNAGVLHFPSELDKYDTLKQFPIGKYSNVLNYHNEKLWIVTTGAIYWYDLKTQESGQLPGDYSDLARYDFYSHSGFIDSEDNVYFGSNGGYLRFNPSKTDVYNKLRYMEFTSLQISRNKILPFTGVLKNGNISTIKNITLDHDQTDITIDFDLIDFSYVSKLTNRYRLIGLNDDWVELGKGRSIKFNHIPTGNYTLEVEASVPHQPDVKKTITLGITVLPPWWATWWFRILCVVATLLLIALFVHRKMERMKEQKRELEEKVKERTADLGVALKEKDRLISVIAHDLRNPMFGIASSLDGLISRSERISEQERNHTLSDIRNSAYALQGELNKLLSWAQSGEGQIAWRYTDVDMEQVSDNVLLLLHEMLERKHQTVEKNFSLNVPALADVRSIEVVIRNLVTNAIKFTPDGGTIRINGYLNANGQVAVEVSDNGVGMTSEQLANLKEKGMHQSTVGTDKEKGSGLGVSLCQDYMTKNKGTLEIESEQGKGSTFRIIVPASSNPLNRLNKDFKDEARTVEIDNELLKESLVLVVDDDNMIRQNLADMLDTHANVATAENGEQALQVAEDQQPDIIVSDVEMPVMNGIEFNKALSASDSTNHIPLLFISARNEEEMRVLGLRTGAIDYISKPFSQVELLLKLSNILTLRKKQQEKLMAKLMTQGKVEQEEEKSVNPFVKRVFEIVEQNYANGDFSIEDFAREAAVSQSTLSRKLKTLVNKTPLEILVEYRLNTAMNLIKQKDTETSISDIAYSVGFNDPAYFTRKFKEHFGMAPSKATE